MNPSGKTTRRDFLARAARASVVVVGPGWLSRAAQEAASRPASAPAPPAPESPWAPVLARIRAESKSGLVIRFPEDPDSRRRIVGAIDAALDDRIPGDDGIEASTVFLDSVIACAESSAVERWIDGAREPETVVLIDSEGRRIDGLAAPLEDLTSPERLMDRLKRLLHGPRLERLRPRAQALRLATPERSLSLLAEAAGPTGVTDESATIWMLPHPSIVSLAWHDAVDPKHRTRIGWIVESMLARSEEDLPGAALPFGLALTRPSRDACGRRMRGTRELLNVACGMGRVRAA